jgi:hypothetical protein
MWLWQYDDDDDEDDNNNNNNNNNNNMVKSNQLQSATLTGNEESEKNSRNTVEV